MSDKELAQTERMNLLIDFYGTLLTEKQRQILGYYFEEDYSLSEIAEQQTSRSAVYDLLKRCEKILEDYESKLHLLRHYQVRIAQYEKLKALHIAEVDALVEVCMQTE